MITLTAEELAELVREQQAEITSLREQLDRELREVESLSDDLTDAQTQLEDYEEFCTDDPRALADAVARRVSVFDWPEFKGRLDQNIQMEWIA